MRRIGEFAAPQRGVAYRPLWLRAHLDLPLLFGVLVLIGAGLVILYSAGGQDLDLLYRQGIRLGLAFIVMILLAQVPPRHYQVWAPWLFGVGLFLLVAVLLVGVVGKGAQRWLDLKLFRFQPSEIMKVAVPMMMAWFLADKPLPPGKWPLVLAGLIITVPVLLIAKQPDLGTSLLIASAGMFALFLAGMSWALIGSLGLLGVMTAPLLWYAMHDYQRDRVLTFIDPERDPLGAGYHIIQSEIAIGSGGLYGKGWLNGTQSHLDFLPERSTDFIFAVHGEELGLLGALLLLSVYVFIVLRGLYISNQAQDAFCRLLGGSLTLTFFVYFFVNIGMVTGILPVVGLPLPLVSYGGTSLVTLLSAFGMLMSIHTHRKLLPA